ncbi:MAG: hypothetical protein JWM11_7627, partial [Planctomycetaceae bacterium]|nr:hypothetical protein [Planctomycetaceae bacterium]
EVKRGFEFFYQSNRLDLIPPPVLAVEEYFRSRAPERLETIPDLSVTEPDSSGFRRQAIDVESDTVEKNPLAVSFIVHWRVSGAKKQKLIFSDMANGGIDVVNPNVTPCTSHRLMQLNNPVVATRCDLNGNGLPDLVVADLGSFNPADHQLGRVMWLPDVHENQSVQPGVALAEGLGRVADVQPADFDGDGDLDLVVAEFGWHKTGRILLFRNDGSKTAPQFVQQVLDSRPGTIHVPVVDLNHDGRPDFVALISQEFEVIEAFLNQGNGTFVKQPIYAADDPAFGSSGIQMADIDLDGDDDVLFTNGDMFDSFQIKPYYGIQWLENTGNYPFTLHRLTTFPGVLRALAGDLDHDGDIDVIAGAFLPQTVRESDAGRVLDSLIWLEQTSAGRFVRHTIENGNCIHATLDLADFDADGDLDIATGAFRDRSTPTGSAVTIWWNELPAPKPKS